MMNLDNSRCSDCCLLLSFQVLRHCIPNLMNVRSIANSFWAIRKLYAISLLDQQVVVDSTLTPIATESTYNEKIWYRAS